MHTRGASIEALSTASDPFRGQLHRVLRPWQPTAATTRWRVSVLPSTPLPVPGIGRARWGLELVRCRGGRSAAFEVEASDAKGRLALASTLAYRITQAVRARM